jgi:hypothetical protein
MGSEIVFDLCFVRDQCEDFETRIHDELMVIFENKLHWYIDYKCKENLEIVVAEVKGVGSWISEDELLTYIEEKASEQFFIWLQGYHLQLFPVVRGGFCCAKQRM